MTSKMATMESSLKGKEEILRKATGEKGATAEELAQILGIDPSPPGARTLFTTAIGKMGFNNKKVGGEGKTTRSLWHESFPKTIRTTKSSQTYSPCVDKTQDHSWSDTGGG